MNDHTRVVLTGGISGGHTYPLVAVARAMRKQFASHSDLKEDIELLFIGSRGQFEQTAMEHEHIPVKYILTGKWRRYFSWHNLLDPIKIPMGLVQALWHLFFFMPDAVMAKGGSASVPVVLAAWLYRIPILIHDSDAVAGWANRLLSLFASRVAIAYPSAHAYFPVSKTALTGNPVREELLLGDAARGLSRFGFTSQKPVVFIMGGSQGAHILNQAILDILPTLLQKNIQVLHQTGIKNYDDIVASVETFGLKIGESGYMPKSFLEGDELADAFSCATLAISRAGAGSIAELAATKKAVILVPLNGAANDEQRMNAYDVAELGGALVVEEANLGENMLLEKIESLLSDASLRATMGEKLASFYRPDAAQAIASGVLDLIQIKKK